MYQGIAFAFLSYASYSSGDTAIKALGGRLSVFEVAFFGALFAVPMLVFLKPAATSWGSVLAPRRPTYLGARAVFTTIAALCGTTAFQTLPFAEAYAILFLAPSFTALWSVLFLRERISPVRWASILVGLAGVILVVRPGFAAVTFGHVAALGGALAGSISMILLRIVTRTEHSTGIMATTLVASLLVNGFLMAPSFHVPTGVDLALLGMVGLGGGLGQILQMAATRRAPISRIVPTQYSQIGWALLWGSVFFGEVPDNIAMFGIAFVVVSGLMNLLQTDGAPAAPAPVIPKPVREPVTAPVPLSRAA